MLCWAGEVGDDRQVTVAGRSVDVGPRHFHHEKVGAEEAIMLACILGVSQNARTLPELNVYRTAESVPH